MNTMKPTGPAQLITALFANDLVTAATYANHPTFAVGLKAALREVVRKNNVDAFVFIANRLKTKDIQSVLPNALEVAYRLQDFRIVNRVLQCDWEQDKPKVHTWVKASLCNTYGQGYADKIYQLYKKLYLEGSAAPQGRRILKELDNTEERPVIKRKM